VAIFNQERINLEKFGDESIEQFSTFVNVQFDEKQPNWIPMTIHRNVLSDQAEYINWDLGTVEYSYNSIQIDQPLPSAWTKYPKKENGGEGKYKFSSIFLTVSLD